MWVPNPVILWDAVCMPWTSRSRRAGVHLRYFYLTLGQALVAAAIFLLSFLWMWYWLQSHNYNGYWPDPPNKIFESEKVARAFGQLAVLFFRLTTSCF